MNSVEIGKVVKEKRLSLNMRMDDIAREAGITRQTLSSIENGAGNYSFSSLLKVLDVLRMSIDINSGDDKKTSRQRATRANTKLDKQINRFIVLCIEEYAEYAKKPSYIAYPEMKEKGLIDLLREDYEGMHGMSTLYINTYIDDCLKARK